MSQGLPQDGIRDNVMRKKIVTAGLAAIAVIALAGFGVWYFLDSQKAATEPVEAITVAYSPFEYTALFWIADDQHFFEKNGLNLTLRKYDSGAASLDGVANGEADITVGVTEFPLVTKGVPERKSTGDRKHR